VLFELEPAPDGVLLPGLEFPPLPASPPEPGSAVPLVFAPLVPLGSEDFSESDDFASEDDDELLMLLPELSLGLALVAATTGSDNTQVNPAIANA